MQRLSSQLKEAVAAAQSAASAAAATSTHSTANDKALNARIAELSAANAELQASAGSATAALYRGGSGHTAGVLQHSTGLGCMQQLGQGLALANDCMRKTMTGQVCYSAAHLQPSTHCTHRLSLAHAAHTVIHRILPNADTAALQRDLDQQRLANQGLEAEVACLTAAAAAAAAAAEASNPTADEGGGGGGAVELELLRHELEDLRHDNREMEAGFHEAAAQVGTPLLRYC